MLFFLWQSVARVLHHNTPLPVLKYWLKHLLSVQACPPQGFPFYGLPPSMLAQLSLQHLQPQVLKSCLGMKSILWIPNFPVVKASPFRYG